MPDLKEFDAPNFSSSTFRLDRPSSYLLAKARRDDENGYDNLKKSMSSATIYIGGLTFTTTEEQLFELFNDCGSIKQIIMVKFMNKTKINGKPMNIDLDPGFEEGRQFGRGADGGQKQRMFGRRRFRPRHFNGYSRGGRSRYNERRERWSGGRDRVDSFRDEEEGSRPRYERERDTYRPEGREDYRNERRNDYRSDRYRADNDTYRGDDSYTPNNYRRTDTYIPEGGAEYARERDAPPHYQREGYRDHYRDNYRDNYRKDYSGRPERDVYVPERSRSNQDDWNPENIRGSSEELPPHLRGRTLDNGGSDFPPQSN
ncbi:hypothetical protein HII13_002098 [Brettanomyces bruxellensis]|nr:hypothetical protein HII13_002098 [Brettanomyces bruxellensis]